MENRNKYEWNLKLLYKDENDPQIEKDIEESTKKVNHFISKWKKDRSYLKSPKRLAVALKEYTEFMDTYGIFAKPTIYFGLRLTLNQEDKILKAKENLIIEKHTDLVNQIQFFDLNIGKISKKIQNTFLESKELSEYHHLLKRKFLTSKYDLTNKEEKIINLLIKSASSNWITMVSEFVGKETGKICNKILTFDQLLSRVRSNKKKERNLTNKVVNKILEKWVDVAEHEINSFLEVDKNLRRLRQFPDFDFERHMDDDIDQDTVRSLTDTITNSFSLSHRFYDLFTKLLKEKTIGYHEKVLNYEEIEKTYTIDQAFSLVIDIFSKLSPDFGQRIIHAINNGYLDVYPKKNKSGGGFCTLGSKNHPVFVLTNFDGKTADVQTIAHEMGHYLNHVLSVENTNPLESITSIAMAEVASNFFEGFVLEKVLEKSSKEEQFTILIQKLQDDISSIFRQVACYNFEYELHKLIEEKGYLSKTEIGKLFCKHMSSYLGPKVRMDEGHENWWVYWSHIRRPFYVYSYASGQLISKSLQNMVKENPNEIEKIKIFLSKGGSQSPKDIFLELGIDITDKKFWEKGLNEFKNNLEKAEKLAKELGKI